MRRLDKLIEQARRQTENEDVSSTIGIATEEFIQYFNDAQDRLQSAISSTYPNVFLSEQIITLTSGTEAYSIPDNLFLDSRIVNVEISLTGNSQDFTPLRPITYKNRGTYESESPYGYIRKNGQILVNGVYRGSGATIRVTYERALDNLDIRRGAISVVTGTPITSITLASSPTPDTYELPNITTGDYICVSDKDGVVTAYNIPVTGYNSGSRVLTVSSHTLAAGEAAAVGSYVTIGRYSTTHSKLSETAERYLLAYAAWKILKRDSSEDSKDQERELLMLEEDIVKSYADNDRDTYGIPILNDSVLILE